jgi:hypothetical protein
VVIWHIFPRFGILLHEKSGNPVSDGDAYDELLTREEIQTVITKMNLLMALERVEECVTNFDLQVGGLVARWFIFIPKILIWVYFGGPRNGKCLFYL